MCSSNHYGDIADVCLPDHFHDLCQGHWYGSCRHNFPACFNGLGDDAGGQLTAAVANRLSFETRLPPIRFQALIYPLSQSFDYTLYAETTVDLVDRTAAILRWLNYYQGHLEGLEDALRNNHTSAVLKVSDYSQYVNPSALPEGYKTIAVKRSQSPQMENSPLALRFEDFLLNPYANPLMAEEMTHLPPTFMLTAEFDVYRDDGLFYAKRLLDAGVKLEHTHYESEFHGFVSFINGLFEFANTRLAVAKLVAFINNFV